MCLASLAGWPGLRWLRPGPSRVDREAGLIRLLGDVPGDLEKARSLGRRYLASCPGAETGARQLAALLLRVAPADRGELASLLARRRQRDFEGDRVVILQGWVVAETEAQVCALSALSDSSS